MSLTVYLKSATFFIAEIKLADVCTFSSHENQACLAAKLSRVLNEVPKTL